MIRSEDDWKWITDESFNYLNWTANEPINTNGSENYVHLFAHVYSGGKGIKYFGDWNDAANDSAPYSNKFYDYLNFDFICEWEELDVTETTTEEPTSE